MKYRTISVSGSYYTGSSAVVDFLGEFGECYIVPNELDLFYAGLAKLFRPLNDGQSLSPEQFEHIRRSLLRFAGHGKTYNRILSGFRKRYIRNLPRASNRYKLLRSFDHHIYVGSLREIFPNYRDHTAEFCDLLRERLHVLPGQEDELRTLLTGFLEGLRPPSSEYSVLVADQLIRPGHVDLSHLVPTIGIIVVTRDPRDQYCDIRSRSKSKPQFHANEAVHRFIDTYGRRYTKEDQLLENAAENVLRVRFEDLVYDYCNTVESVQAFLGLSAHRFRKRYFDPARSINNTQLFRSYPKQDEIRLIERELSTRLYPFEEHSTTREKG